MIPGVAFQLPLKSAEFIYAISCSTSTKYASFVVKFLLILMIDDIMATGLAEPDTVLFSENHKYILIKIVILFLLG